LNYCTQALWLSEDAACSRIEAARVCRRFPIIVELLASRELTLTAVRLLRRHLTRENHQAVLAMPAPPASTAPSGPPLTPSPAVTIPTPRPVVQPTAPERYRVQFTIGRAITLLLEKVEKRNLGAAAKPRPAASVRSRTDKSRPDRPSPCVPPAIKRATWQHDGGQCGYVAPSGRRCAERTFLEFHHVQPRAKQGPATLANISLRCWRHNQYGLG
jgi:hypothetical protein